MRIYLLIVVICGAGLTGCEDVNPITPSSGTAVARSGAQIELCADPLNRRRPC